MRRQAITLLASAVMAVALFLIGVRLPAPYVRLVPGPVSDTLGGEHGSELITIKGHATAPTKGRIYLVTVGEFGGPGKNLSAADVLSGWWNSTDAVVPVRVLYPPQETAKQAAQQDAADMDQSQEDAKIAALRYLGYKLQPGAEVSNVEATSTAKGKLQLRDVIVGVDSATVASSVQLVTVLNTHKVGDQVTLKLNRNGTMTSATVTLQKPIKPGGSPSIGIGVLDSYAIPFEIDIDLSNVGGPSAGMAFALGIIDKLSDGNLTGGMTIAGTGTIDADGNVGAIGGVEQKMAGARKAGATVFLVPKDNCAEALKAVPKGLRLVQVTTLAGAVDAIKQVRDGGKNVPSCSAS
ncbi:MAG: YlbL family protein [Acidothermaceae bacterium]